MIFVRSCLRSILSVCLTLLLLTFTEAYLDISDMELMALERPNGDFDINNGAILHPILRTRVPGTPGSTAVLNHFVDFFRATLPGWKVQFQNSTSKTPISENREVPFVNFIASRDPPWAASGDVGRLTLAAHYDSKYEPEGFIGAIDSAAPCAIIMHAMRGIDAALTKKWTEIQANSRKYESFEGQKGIQVLFLDGEEAFKQWSDEDSLYGARSLAEQWDNEFHPAMSAYKTPLTSISLFVLLDLLGAKSPAIHSHFETTHWSYQKLANLEKRLRHLNMFKSSSGDPEANWFIDAAKHEHELLRHSGIQDDHIPFLARGVEVLHIIDASPLRGFPSVWHTIDDSAENLDIDTVEDWSLLITAFAAEWMELASYMPTLSQPEKKRWDKNEL